MSQQKKDQQLFAMGFAITFFVFSLLAVGTVFYLNPLPPGGFSSSAPSDQPYLPTTEEDLTLLFLACPTPEENPSVYLLVGFKPFAGKIPILPLLGDTQVVWQGQAATLDSVYEQGGAQEAAKALSSFLEIPVDRYYAIARENLIQAVDAIGQVSYQLPYPVTLREYDNIVTIEAGNQLLDGRRMAQLAIYDSYPGGETERLNIAAEMAEAFVNQHLSLALSPNGGELAAGLLNLAQTNLTATDLEARGQALEFLAQLQTQPGKAIPLLGSYDTGAGFFLPDSQTIKLAQRLFGNKIEEAEPSRPSSTGKYPIDPAK